MSYVVVAWEDGRIIAVHGPYDRVVAHQKAHALHADGVAFTSVHALLPPP